MTRFVTVSMLVVLVLLAMPRLLLAQTGGGSLRGYVKDEQGGVLPGATITATSPSVATPYKGVTDTEGLYRLNNLSPGVYSITVELDGFATFIRQNVVLGAALNLNVDIVMKLRSVAETVTVVADSPLLETSKAGQAVNVSGEMTQTVPLAARRHWSEYLRFTPGAVVNDGTQNQAATFYFHGAGFNSYRDDDRRLGHELRAESLARVFGILRPAPSPTSRSARTASTPRHPSGSARRRTWSQNPEPIRCTEKGPSRSRRKSGPGRTRRAARASTAR